MTAALAHYESFLIHNASTISTIESTLRSITWFLPGRFKDAELASEALSAALNLLSLYHDTLLARRISQSGLKLTPLLPPSAHARYTRAWADNHPGYKLVARSLEVIKFVQLVVEMGLKRTLGHMGRWRGIVSLEVVKFILRLLLLRITRQPLLSPPIPERELDPATIPPPGEPQKPEPPPPEPSLGVPAHLQNNHIAFTGKAGPNPLLIAPPPPLSPMSIEDYLLPKALSLSSVRAPAAQIKPLLSPRDWAAEIVWALKPLVYALAMARKSTTPRPLVISLFLELLSRSLRRTPPPSEALERSEYARRDKEILWYLLRGDIWQAWTRPKLEWISNSTSRAPVLGLVSAFINDWIPLIDEYHYYTWT